MQGYLQNHHRLLWICRLAPAEAVPHKEDGVTDKVMEELVRELEDRHRRLPRTLRRTPEQLLVGE